MSDPVGLSIGTTNLVAVRSGNQPVTRRSVLTLFPHRAAQPGVPAENPSLTETGLLMSGFVERIGDSVALVSADGSAHDADLLLVEALDAMVCAVGADAATSEISIAVPAHWRPKAVRALRDGLRTHAGFVRSGVAPCLVSDAVAALTALNSDARLPARGVVALFDFGGGGTSITLAEAGTVFEPIGETLRYSPFSGDQIDQALMLHVLDGIGRTGETDPTGTAAVGQLAQLPEQCRRAKEQLSAQTVTEVVADQSGIKVSRIELEHLIADQLSGLLLAFDDMLTSNQVAREDLRVAAAVGGGANIPFVTQQLSSHMRVPLVTAAQPAFCMAVGAAMFACREPAQGRASAEAEENETPAPTAMSEVVGASTGSFSATTGSFSASTGSFGATTGSFSASTDSFGFPASDEFVDEDKSSTMRELAWSQADDTDNEPVSYSGERYRSDPYGKDPYGNDEVRATPSQVLPRIEPPEELSRRRYRVPQLLLGLGALIAMFAIGGVVYSLTGTPERQVPPMPTSSTAVPPPPAPPSSQPPAPSVESAPSSVEPPASSVEPPAPSVEAPAPSIETPPSSVAPPSLPSSEPAPVTTTYQPPPATTAQQPPTATATMTPTTTPAIAPPTAATTTPTVAMTTEYLTVPFVPLPIPIRVPQR
jgi:hypothetical protein